MANKSEETPPAEKSVSFQKQPPQVPQFEDYEPPFDQIDLEQIYPNYSHAMFKKVLKVDEFNYSLGCLFGSFIGDALGAYCEFQKQISNQLLEKTMKMDGGGTFKLRMGQFTDDSELASHLLEGLSLYDKTMSLSKQSNFLISKIACNYVDWAAKGPFDIGITTNKAINVLKSHHKVLREANSISDQQIKEVLDQVYNINKESQSNGSLMRIAPMAMFVSLLKIDHEEYSKVKDFIKNQIRLIHPNEDLVEASKDWVKLLVKLINRQKNEPLSNPYKFVVKSKLKDWIEVAKQQQMMDAKEMKGWAKIAWTFGIRYLRLMSEEKIPVNEDTYSNILSEVIKQGGDTDTNAAIVGGLIGSIVGFKRLPREYIRKMMKLRFPLKKEKATDRPFIYEPRYSLGKALTLMKNMNGFQFLK